MQKIKVLHLIKNLGLGGAEANLCNLVQAFDRERFQMHIGYSGGGPLKERFLASGAILFRFAEKDHKIKSPASFFIILKIAFYLKKNRIRIVHTHNFNAHIWGVLAAKLAGAKVVEHVHDFRYTQPDEYKRLHGEVKQFKYIKYFKKLSDIVIVLTRENYDYLLVNNFCRLEQARLIQNGIPISSVKSPESEKEDLRRKLEIGPLDTVIFTSCRIAPEKNVDLILRIAPEIKAQYPQAVFIISGDGPFLTGLRAQVKAQGREEAVKLIGFNREISDLLAVSGIFLLPSYLELHSIAILEAMNAGVAPVVSSSAGANSEFIRNWENGVLADPFVDSQWVDVLSRLLKDADLRRRMGEEAQNYCRKNFDIKDTAKKIEAIYGQLA